MHRLLMPLYPYAVEQLDLRAYDLVLSSDSGPIKGVLLNESAVHVCYCHSPMRYLWGGYHDYRSAMSPLIRFPFSLAAHYVRNWDSLAAQRVTHFVANSEYVAKRIRQYYGRESTVVYPPVDVGRGFLANARRDFYLAAGRLVPYKKTEILIEACNILRRPLRIVGSGPEMEKLRRIAGPSIEFLPDADDQTLWQNYAECRALLFAADEDFGMVPVEAQSCGRPVIAFGKGGSRETINGAFFDGHHRLPEKGAPTGIFFHEQTTHQVVQAILAFEAMEPVFVPSAIQQHAQRFSSSRFVSSLSALIAAWAPNASERIAVVAEDPAA